MSTLCASVFRLPFPHTPPPHPSHPSPPPPLGLTRATSARRGRNRAAKQGAQGECDGLPACLPACVPLPPPVLFPPSSCFPTQFNRRRHHTPHPPPPGLHARSAHSSAFVHWTSCRRAGLCVCVWLSSFKAVSPCTGSSTSPSVSHSRRIPQHDVTPVSTRTLRTPPPGRVSSAKNRG